MKRIKGVRRSIHKLIMKVVNDYYLLYDESSKKVMSYLSGEKVELSEIEKADARKIKNNMEDKIYADNLN